MKKIFSYIVGIIMVLSSVIAISHFVTPSEDKNINAESVEYVTIPFDCFDLTTYYCGDDSNATITPTLGKAQEVLSLSDSSSLKDKQTYAIIGMKTKDYVIQTGAYKGQTLGEFLTAHPFIELPTYINVGEGNTQTTDGVIVGLSYVRYQNQYDSGYGDYNQETPNANYGRGGLQYFNTTGTFDSLLLIKGIRIPKTYVCIGKSSFARIPNLTEVEFMNDEIGKGYFGKGVFEYATSLNKCIVSNQKNTLPNHLNTIPVDTFYSTSIKSVYIPNNITTICDSAFQDCFDLTTVTFEKNSVLTKVSDWAFENCYALEDIILPNSLNTINKYAFCNTFALKNLTIPASVTNIKEKVFYFGEDEFNDDKYNYEDVACDYSFDSPRAIIFEERDENNVDITFGSDVFATDGKEGYNYSQFYYVYYNKTGEDDTLHKELDSMFSASKRKNNTIGYYIDHTDLNADYYLYYNVYTDYKNNMKTPYWLILDTNGLFGSSNTAPNSYNVGSKLVVDNNGLASTYLTLDSEKRLDLTQYEFKGWSIFFNGTEYGLEEGETISDQTPIYTDVAIYANYEIKFYDVKVGDIEESVPYGTKLSEIFSDSYLYNGDLDPQNLNYVGLYTDSKFTTLVNWDDEVTSNITLYSRNVPFENLYNFNYDADNDGYVIAGLKSNIGSVSQLYIPATYNAKPVIGIADRAFIQNNSLSKLYFADFDKDSTFTIGTYAFQGCSNLTYAELPVSNLTVKANAFVGTNLTEITLLGSVNFGTRGSYNLASNSLPNGCKLMQSSDDEPGTDYEVQSISVIIKIDNKTIKYSLFPHHFVYLPTENDEITSKTGYYFVGYMMDCKDGNGFQGDLSGGYYDYVKLFSSSPADTEVNIYFKAVLECKFDMSENTVNGWSDTYSIYVQENYKNDKKYFEVVDLPDNATVISNEAFKGDANIKKLIINKNLVSISNYAFSGCTNLKEVVFPEDYEKFLYIGGYSFEDCKTLTSFGKIANDKYVKFSSIGEAAFINCKSLSEFYMSADSDLTILNPAAFIYCQSLRTINIPKSVTTIGESCFSGCIALTSVVFADNSNLTTLSISTFADSGITTINLDKTLLQYIGASAFERTKNLNSISLVSRAEILYFSSSDSSNIFYGSGVREITLPCEMELNSAVFTTIFNGANNLQKIVVVGDGNYLNYNDDGIIYHRTGDMVSVNGTDTAELVIDYIPYAYTGTLTIPACVTSITALGSSDSDLNIIYSFHDLKKVTQIVGESDYMSDKNYVVIDGDLYYKGLSGIVLAYVPNRTLNQNTYTVRSIIELGDVITLKVVGLYKYALNSNTNIKVLSFEDNDNFASNAIPQLISHYIEAIVVPKFITTIDEENFIYLYNLRTIKVQDTITVRGAEFSFVNSYAAGNAFYANISKPLILVPSEDVAVYSTLPDFSALTVRSSLNVVYNANGGEALKNGEFDFGTTPNVTDAVKTGFDFVGWYTDESLSTPYVPSALYSDITLYAKYNRHSYTYTYMVDDETYFTEDVLYDTVPSGPESAPSKKGKVFVGWKTADGVDYSLEENKATTNIILYAEFKTDNKYITKLIIIAVASVVVLGAVITIIAKSVKKKKAYKK